MDRSTAWLTRHGAELPWSRTIIVPAVFGCLAVSGCAGEVAQVGSQESGSPDSTSTANSATSTGRGSGSTTDGAGPEPRGWSIHGEASQGPESIGRAIAGVGDINGDGFGDLVLGAPAAEGVGAGSGRVYVVYGKADNTDVELTDVARGVGGYAIEAENAGDALGQCIAAAGDLNADGIGDILVGAPDADHGAGRAYVIFGGAPVDTVKDLAAAGRGFAIHAETSTPATPSYRGLGIGLDSAGDVDADGATDLVLGSAAQGHVYVLFSSAGIPADRHLDVVAAGDGGFLIDDGDSWFGIGRWVHGLGDFDGDGYEDVLVGDEPFGYQTDAVIVYGKPDTESIFLLPDVPDREDIAWITNRSGLVGPGPYGTGAVGDFNGDGLADLLIGEKEFAPDFGGPDVPASIYVIQGGAERVDLILPEDGWASGLQITGEGFSSYGGVFFATSDMSGDGLVDVAIQVEFWDDNFDDQPGWLIVKGIEQSGRLKAHDVLGSSAARFGLFVPSDALADRFCLSSAGDIDADGRADLVTPAPYAGPAGRVDVLPAAELFAE